MTTVKLCDFCQDEIRENSNAKLTYYEGVNKELDVCKSCLKKIFAQKKVVGKISSLQKAKKDIFG